MTRHGNALLLLYSIVHHAEYNKVPKTEIWLSIIQLFKTLIYHLVPSSILTLFLFFTFLDRVETLFCISYFYERFLFDNPTPRF